MDIFKFLLKLIPSSALAKLQNLPNWAYVAIVAVNGAAVTLYQYYVGQGLKSDAAVVNYISLALAAIFGAKALPTQPQGEFDVPDGK